MSKVRIDRSSDTTYSEVQRGRAVDGIKVGLGCGTGYVIVRAIVICRVERREVGALILGGGIILGKHSGSCYRGEREEAKKVHNGQMIDNGQVENC
jgi:hypothetical protein